jgi:hypothetical protein
MDLHTSGMEFASEMVVKASLLGMKVVEVPTTLSPDGRSRPPHLRSWSDGWRHLRFLLLFSPRWLFLMPGMALFLLGGLLGALLTVGPLHVGRVEFDTNSLLVCVMTLLVGFELMAFAVFAKTFAIREGLLPPDPRMDRFLGAVSLEAGLVVGLGTLAAGLGLLVCAVLYWVERDLGHLSYPESLRLTIPSITLIILGVQIIFSSLLLGVLRLRWK